MLKTYCCYWLSVFMTSACSAMFDGRLASICGYLRTDCFMGLAYEWSFCCDELRLV